MEKSERSGPNILGDGTTIAMDEMAQAADVNVRRC